MPPTAPSAIAAVVDVLFGSVGASTTQVPVLAQPRGSASNCALTGPAIVNMVRTAAPTPAARRLILRDVFMEISFSSGLGDPDASVVAASGVAAVGGGNTAVTPALTE